MIAAKISLLPPPHLFNHTTTSNSPTTFSSSTPKSPCGLSHHPQHESESCCIPHLIQQGHSLLSLVVSDVGYEYCLYRCPRISGDVRMKSMGCKYMLRYQLILLELWGSVLLEYCRRGRQLPWFKGLGGLPRPVKEHPFAAAKTNRMLLHSNPHR